MDDSLLYHSFPIKIRQCRHGAMMFLETDDYIGRSLDLYGEYCESEVVIFQQLIKPDHCVIDAGANMGAHSIVFSKLVGPRGVVHAFEPQRKLYQILCSNAVLNGANNLRTYNKCLGQAKSNVSMASLTYDTPGNFGGLSVDTRYDTREDVEIDCIDNLKLKRCDFIKIDVEGFERNVILGAGKTLFDFQPVLWVEDDREDNSAALRESIKKKGYRVFHYEAMYFNETNFFGNSVNVFELLVARNLLCLPERLNAVETPGFIEV